MRRAACPICISPPGRKNSACATSGASFPLRRTRLRPLHDIGSGLGKVAPGGRREPIVRVSLVDTKNNNLVAQRYIKVRWTGEKEQTIPAYTFPENIVTCHDMWRQMFSQAMNENVYHQIKFDGGQSISKTQFHTIYTAMKINELRKDGVKVDLSKLAISTAATDWNEGTDRVKEDGGELINNKKDLVFTMIKDAEDNTSYNLVWAMNPKTVGTLAQVDGKYASTFEIDVEYVDESGLNGNIKQTFKQTIVAR